MFDRFHATKSCDHIRVSMHGGEIVEAIIKAVIEHKDGLRFQVA
jgi:hypothetical protein